MKKLLFNIGQIAASLAHIATALYGINGTLREIALILKNSQRGKESIADGKKVRESEKERPLSQRHTSSATR